MSALNIPLPSALIRQVSLLPVDECPAVWLLDVAFDSAHFSESLFATLNIPPPAHLSRSVTRRRAEYLVSRYCLREALAGFGVEQFVLTNGEDRAPLWPQGINGSLSHTHHQVCALLTKQADILLGIDCEQIMTAELARETHGMLVNEAEKLRLQQSGLPFNTALTVAFSLKESLYKALYPRVRQFIDFGAAEVIALSEDGQSVSLRLTRTLSPELAAGRTFCGRVTLRSDRVITWIIEPQDSH